MVQWDGSHAVIGYDNDINLLEDAACAKPANEPLERAVYDGDGIRHRIRFGE